MMVQCTTYGYGEKPGLLKKEVDELKETVRVLYPKSPHVHVCTCINLPRLRFGPLLKLATTEAT